MRSFGISIKAGLTKGEASDLLDRATKDPSALQRQQELREHEFEKRRQEEVKFPSYFLRRAIQSATADLEQIRREKTQGKTGRASLAKRLAAAEKEREADLLNDALTDKIQAIKREIADARATDNEPSASDFKDAEAELKESLSRRSNFWKATFSK